MAGCSGRGRSVEQERLHEQRLAFPDRAEKFAVTPGAGGNFRAPQETVDMAARGNLERTIGVVALIQVEPDGEQLLQDAPGRAGIINAVLF